MTEPAVTQTAPETPEQTAKSKGKIPPAALVATAGTMPAEPSPRQKQATKLRAELGPIVEILVAGDPRDPSSPIKRIGASLMVAHLATELPALAAESRSDPGAVSAREVATKWAFGPEVAALDKVELYKLAAGLRLRFPGIWGAANRGDVANFVRHLRIARLRGFPGDETPEAICVAYQSVTSILGAPPITL